MFLPLQKVHSVIVVSRKARHVGVHSRRGSIVDERDAQRRVRFGDDILDSRSRSARRRLKNVVRLLLLEHLGDSRHVGFWIPVVRFSSTQVQGTKCREMR